MIPTHVRSILTLPGDVPELMTSRCLREMDVMRTNRVCQEQVTAIIKEQEAGSPAAEVRGRARSAMDHDQRGLSL
jgi:hypothetical protein